MLQTVNFCDFVQIVQNRGVGGVGVWGCGGVGVCVWGGCVCGGGGGGGGGNSIRFLDTVWIMMSRLVHHMPCLQTGNDTFNKPVVSIFTEIYRSQYTEKDWSPL